MPGLHGWMEEGPRFSLQEDFMLDSKVVGEIGLSELP